MHEQQHKRNYSLPHRVPQKNVVFSAVLQGDKNGVPIAKDIGDIAITSENNLWHIEKTSYTAGPGTYAFDHVPTLVRTPWEQQRPVKRWSWPSRRSSQLHSRRPSPKPFDRIPDEIYHLILAHLNDLHQPPTGVCADCLLHDMHSLSAVSKTWHKAANKHMYGSLWLPLGQRSSRLPRRNRLKLLLRTLQERPDLAGQVEYIYAAIRNEGVQSQKPNPGLPYELISIAEKCLNLEAFRGFYPRCSVDNPSNEINMVLASRKSLREYVWLLEGRQGSLQALCPFIQYPDGWSKLETLVVRDASFLLGQGSMYAILRRLPSLQHLALIGLSSSAFHNGTLQALRGLKSLRLEALAGLSDLGLEQPLPQLAGSLRKLSLVDLDIKTLRTVSKILANFRKLRRFTIVQDNPPGLPLGAEVVLAKELPLLSSSSVTDIHWEMLVPGSANQALETSIRRGGFPCLRSLRAPCDSDGSLQSLCRPVARLKISEEETRAYKQSESQGYTRDLTHARTAAQLRTRSSTETPAVSIVIQDDDSVRYTQVMGRYLGDIHSGVCYNLESDFDGTKHALGYVDDLLDCGTLECSGKLKGKSRHIVMKPRALHSLF